MGFNMSKLNQVEIDNIINLYQNTNMTLIEIAKLFGYKSKDIIYKILLDYNTPKRRSIKFKISLEQESEIINMYTEKEMTEKEISQYYGININIISRVLNRNKIKTNYCNKKYNINEDYFEKIDTINKAYLLGFIYADGYIRKDGLVLSVVVHHKDIDILEKIKNELNTETNIAAIKNKNHNRINICNIKLCSDLIKLGCNNNKTFNLQFPNIDTHLVPHFIRGFMDGDGCISIRTQNNKKYFSLSFTGTKEMMDKLKEVLNVDNTISFYKNAYALHIGKKKDVLRILDWIYKDANLYLQRKYNKYCEIRGLTV